MPFKKLRQLFSIILLIVISQHSYSVQEDAIRYRSIVYFYPDTKPIPETALGTYLEKFSRVNELPNTIDKAYVSFLVTSDFHDRYPVPDMQYLSYFGRGIDKQQLESIQQSKLALIIDIGYPEDMSFEGLKLINAFLFEISTTFDGLIWDSETRELFGPDKWKERRIDSWSDNLPTVEKHTVIHAYQNGAGIRAITLGMAKFGQPDIVVNNFSWSLNQEMGNLINLTAQSMVENINFNLSPKLKLDINNIKNTSYKNELTSSLKENAEQAFTINTGRAKWEEGDPENLIIELLFDDEQGDSLSEKQERLLSRLFGWEDTISYVKHNELILAASDRAKTKLAALQAKFNKGLSPGEYILLKAPFKTPDGGKEWMWVEVLSWKGNSIEGLLKNEPANIPSLKAGEELTIRQDDVFDYIRYLPDGTAEGNETGKLIQEYSSGSR